MNTAERKYFKEIHFWMYLDVALSKDLGYLDTQVTLQLSSRM